MTPNEYRENSIHIAIGNVFGMVAEINDLLNDSTTACRDRMKELYSEDNAKEYFSACMESCEIEKASNAFRHIMLAAMKSAHGKIWPVEDWD